MGFGAHFFLKKDMPKKKRTPFKVSFCDHVVQLPTSLWDAISCTGILPRAKKHATGMFLTFASLRPPFRIPYYPPRKRKNRGISLGFVSGVDNGIRTHDLQSHNLTR